MNEKYLAFLRWDESLKDEIIKTLNTNETKVRQLVWIQLFIAYTKWEINLTQYERYELVYEAIACECEEILFLDNKYAIFFSHCWDNVVVDIEKRNYAELRGEYINN